MRINTRVNRKEYKTVCSYISLPRPQGIRAFRCRMARFSDNTKASRCSVMSCRHARAFHYRSIKLYNTNLAFHCSIMSSGCHNDKCCRVKSCRNRTAFHHSAMSCNNQFNKLPFLSEGEGVFRAPKPPRYVTYNSF
jgi:hypothetical protein